MFCSNCGKELSENTKFCSNCGAPTEINSQPQQSQQPQQTYYTPTGFNQQPQQSRQAYYNAPTGFNQPPQQPQQPYYSAPTLPQQPPKKKGSPLLPILLIVAAVLVVVIVLLVVFMVLPTLNSKEDKAPSSLPVESNVLIVSEEESSLPEEEPSSAVEEIPSSAIEELPSSKDIALESTIDVPTTNPAYEEIFLSRYIVDMPTLFFGMESEAFATVSDEGMVEKLEFGYNGDIIKEMVDTVYYPIADFTDDEKAELEKILKETFAEIDVLDFCTSEYLMLGNYYCVTFTFKDLDNADHVQILTDLGLIDSSNARYISMKSSEESLLNSGYIKR